MTSPLQHDSCTHPFTLPQYSFSLGDYCMEGIHVSCSSHTLSIDKNTSRIPGGCHRYTQVHTVHLLRCTYSHFSLHPSASACSSPCFGPTDSVATTAQTPQVAHQQCCRSVDSCSYKYILHVYSMSGRFLLFCFMSTSRKVSK